MGHIKEKWTNFPMPNDDARLFKDWARRDPKQPVEEWLKDQAGNWTSAQALVCSWKNSHDEKDQCGTGPLAEQQMKEKSERVVTVCSRDATGEHCTEALSAYV